MKTLPRDRPGSVPRINSRSTKRNYDIWIMEVGEPTTWGELKNRYEE